jgi:hypothetical protein
MLTNGINGGPAIGESHQALTTRKIMPTGGHEPPPTAVPLKEQLQTAGKGSAKTVVTFKEPHVGKAGNAPGGGTAGGRRIEIRRPGADVRAANKPSVKNAIGGRVVPAALAAYFTYCTAVDIRESARRWDDPANSRKWDDGARVAGSAMETGAALAALKRGNVRGAYVTMVAGMVLNTIGNTYKD